MTDFYYRNFEDVLRNLDKRRQEHPAESREQYLLIEASSTLMEYREKRPERLKHLRGRKIQDLDLEDIETVLRLELDELDECEPAGYLEASLNAVSDYRFETGLEKGYGF